MAANNAFRFLAIHPPAQYNGLRHVHLVPVDLMSDESALYMWNGAHHKYEPRFIGTMEDPEGFEEKDLHGKLKYLKGFHESCQDMIERIESNLATSGTIEPSDQVVDEYGHVASRQIGHVQKVLANVEGFMEIYREFAKKKYARCTKASSSNAKMPKACRSGSKTIKPWWWRKNACRRRARPPES